jgi:predicted amidohydrolase
VDGSANEVLRAAVVQMTSGADRDANLRQAEGLVAEAAARGATIIVLPETWNLMGGPDAVRAAAEDLDGPSLSAARRWARTHRVWVVAGTVGERRPADDRIANTSVVIGPDGESVDAYRKVHLFDVDVGGRVYRESATTIPGDAVAVADVGGVRLGLSVCYDLRFPELYRALSDRGATVVAVPSAFTERTGQAHWEVLLRARAVENQVFVLAAGQVGLHPDGSRSYGDSMIVDPWGVVLGRADRSGPGVVVADLDLDRQTEVRAMLPALAHRRPDLFGGAGLPG